MNSIDTTTRHTKLRCSQNGTTLFETIVSIALLLLVIGSFAGFVTSIINMREKLISVQEVQDNASFALGILSAAVRRADGINDGTSVFNTNPGTLSLAMSDSSKDPTVFFLDHQNGTLFIQEGASSPVALTSSSVQIPTLQFTRYSYTGGVGTIGIQLSLSFSSQSNAYVSYTDTYQTAARVRK